MAKPKKGVVNFSGGDVKTRFQEALGALNVEEYQILKTDVDEEFTPTDLIMWDECCGLRGIPHGGRVILGHGPEHSGKSTLGYALIRAHQKNTGEPAVIFDFERTLNVDYLRGMGVNVNKDMLLIVKPVSISQAVQHAIVLMKAGVRFLMFDSIPRMRDMVDEKDIMSGDAFKTTVGVHAKSITRFFDLILPYAAMYDACLYMVNQHQARIEMSMEAQMAQKYPSMTNLPYILPGGNQVRYVPSIGIEVKIAKAYRAGGADDDFWFEGTEDAKGAFIANKVKVRVLKNKATSSGFKEATMWIRPGKGVDDWISVRELARHYELISASGRKWVVGDAENPIVTYENKAQAIRELVDEPDYVVLTKLKALVAQRIREDAHGFDTELTQAEKLAFGDGDSGISDMSKFNFNDDEEDVKL